MSKLQFLVSWAILWFSLHHSLHAHPADQSEMRVRPQPHQLEIRFTFNILTLTRFVGIDTNGDAKISMEELNAAQPRIATYLNEHVHLAINLKKATLGSGVQFKALWPEPEKTAPMAEVEFAARNVDVTFVQKIDDKLLEDFWLAFEIFEQTGPMQTIRGIYEQDGRVEEVPFSVQDPEYLHDTGYANDPFLQATEKQGAKAADGSSSAAAPGAAVARRAVEVAPVPEELPPPPALVTTLEGAPATAEAETTASSDQRWWMVRAMVLMVLIVLGRKMQLSARSRLVSSRRRPRVR